MSNSSMVSYVKISPHRTSPRSGRISKITIHHMAGNLSVEGCGSCFTGSRQASSNYGVDSNGKVGMYVEEKDRAWTSSSASNDNVAVTIEVADSTNHAPWGCTAKAMATLVLLCADICRRNGISRLNYTGNTSGNMTLHKWFASTDCPGAYLESQMKKIEQEVNKLLESGATTYTWNGATATGGTGEMINVNYEDAGSGIATLNVDMSKFNPYVVAIEPSVTNVDYKDLIAKQACGMMFEAGCLFGSIVHTKKAYRNKNLAKQVKDCNKAGLRFALYSIVRSRNLDEAKEECKQLYFTASKYPPGMGVWLQLEFPRKQDMTRNHSILDYYYKQLCEWGLQQGCGLYCTREQLESINWEKYQDKFLLWYKNMFKSKEDLSKAEGLIYPEFFQLDPKDPGQLPVVSPDGMAVSNNGIINVSTGLSGNTKGEQIVNYAVQFVGNPYVWGGTSLTNGADCSGFVQSVHAHFGISTPRTSGDQAKAGKSVAGLSAAMPGDVICYSGHVAIYMGNNKIVHASNSKPYPQGGIKTSSPANYKTIVAIRRYW